MKKVIIIGAGVSGLTTGIYLKANGYDVEIDLLPAPNSFPLVLYGGFGPFAASGNPGAKFLEGYDKGTYASGAMKMFYNEYNYWNEDEQSRFKSALTNAGMQ